MQKNFSTKTVKQKDDHRDFCQCGNHCNRIGCFCYFLFANEKENNAKNKAENAQEDPQAKIEEEKEEAKVQLPDLKASQYETDEITTGIDVSEFQGNIDWKAVADSGIDLR